MEHKLDELNEELEELLKQEYEYDLKHPIYEFADLTPEDTNLVAVIWVDGERNMRYGKRIKFQNSTANKLNGSEMIPITISDNPEIPKSIHTKIKIKNKELERIKKWIVLNKQVLTDYADGKIRTKTLYELLQPLND